MKDSPTLLPPRSEMLRAMRARDAGYDGVFYFAVRTTGVFCRPSCPSQPDPANVEYFGSIKECLFAGYRPCKRCHPMEAAGSPPDWVAALQAKVEDRQGQRVTSATLRQLGISPERARRWFQQHYGMTFAAWCRGRRLSGALQQLRAGAVLDDVTFEAGYESHSGFRDAFARAFGSPPGRGRTSAEGIIVALIDSPLGPLLAGTSDQGLCLLEFSDRRMLESNLKTLQRRFNAPLVPGDHPLLGILRTQLSEYFRGQRREFSIPTDLNGTPFQIKVWQELAVLPYGTTISYDTLAQRIGQPTAHRAVARANGMNRISIVIPCHRVIGKDGRLTGYGGGLWRKRLLLELEQGRGFPSTP